MKLRPFTLDGEVTYAGPDPQHPGRGLVVEKHGSTVTHHRCASVGEARNLADAMGLFLADARDLALVVDPRDLPTRPTEFFNGGSWDEPFGPAEDGA